MTETSIRYPALVTEMRFEPARPRRSRARPAIGATFLAAACLLSLGVPGGIQAQGSTAVTLLPGQRYFAPALADPLETRFAIGLLVTDLLSTQGPERSPFTTVTGDDKRDLEAMAAIGGTIPLLRLGGPERGVVIGAQAGVFARFRMERMSRDDLGQDWIVGMPVEARLNDLSARLRIVHRSAHIGDEFSASSGAERIEFGGETIDMLLARQFGGLRLYGGGGWIFHSNTGYLDVLKDMGRADRFIVQLGADGTWHPWPEKRLGLVLGIDVQTAERNAWKSIVALAGGLEFDSGGRAAQLVFRLLDGNSTMGQFFLTKERYGSLEFVLGF
jgi:hypothetical protein